MCVAVKYFAVALGDLRPDCAPRDDSSQARLTPVDAGAPVNPLGDRCYGVYMQTSWLGPGLLLIFSLCGCDHPTVPAQSEAAVPAPAEPSPAPPAPAEPPPAVSGEAVAPNQATASRGKRAPCTNDQSCNGDPTVSALWGHCLKERGVCECNAGFQLHPGGFCRPIARPIAQ